MFAFELVIALPDCPFVLVCGVPGLGSVKASTVSADKPCSEHAVAAVLSAELFSPRDFHLHKLPILRRYDGIVRMLDKVLWDFTFIGFHLFLKKVYREGLLVGTAGLEPATSCL